MRHYAAWLRHSRQAPIRNDTSIMLSPEMYSEFVRPHDARLLHGVGTGSIHSCGKWDHLVAPTLGIPDLRGLDLGNAEMMDLPVVHAACRERNVAVTNFAQTRQDLVSGRSREQFPTGAVFPYYAEDTDDAIAVVSAYSAN